MQNKIGLSIKKLLSQHTIRWGVSFFLILLAALIALGYIRNNTLESIDIYFYDLRIKMNAKHPKLDSRIAIIDIDEKSLSEVGRFPWGRNIVAQLVNQLTQHYQVKTIGFDIQFSEPDTSSGYNTLLHLANSAFKEVPQFKEELALLKPALDYDQLLARAIKNEPVVLGYSFSDTIKKGVLPQPIWHEADLNGHTILTKTALGYTANLALLQQAAHAGGFFNAEVDADGVLRSSPLIIKSGDAFYESLALATARVALGSPVLRPDFVDHVDKDYGVLEALILDTKPHAIRIPVGDFVRVPIHFHGKGGVNGGAYRYFSATDVLHGRLPLEDLKERIVLVGTSAAGLQDLRAVPMNNQYPGVEAHANIVASILDNDFKYIPDYSMAFDFVQIMLIGTLLTIGFFWLKPLSSVIYAVIMIGAILGFNFWAYGSAGLILPVATILVLTGILFIFHLAWGYWFEFRKGRAMTNLFGEYVAPELVHIMAQDPENYSMEGEKRSLTILFADVRNFTSISERLEPNELREYINLYLTAMSKHIHHNRGTLDKYIGDCVMAFWGAPIYLPDHAKRGVETALEMQKTIKKLSQDFAKRGWPTLNIGVGLNTGEVRVGDMGSKIRRAYTVMGDPVNVASRLEGITKEYGVGIIVGEETRHIATDFVYRELDRVRVKGKNEPLHIFEPIALISKLDHAVEKELEAWHQALTLFRAQQWDQAENILHALHGAHPEYVLYTLYLNRIAHYRAHPPESDWDGVTTYHTK